MSGQVQPTPLDKVWSSIRALIRADNTRFTFLGIYEMTVQGVSADGTTVDVSPIDTTQSLPSLVKVKVRLPIATATVAIGQRCIIAFLNGDPTKPVMVNSDPVPLNATHDASGTLNVGPSASSVAIAGGSGVAYLVRNGEAVVITGAVSGTGSGQTVSGILTLALVEAAPGPPGTGHSKAVA